MGSLLPFDTDALRRNAASSRQEKEKPKKGPPPRNPEEKDTEEDLIIRLAAEAIAAEKPVLATMLLFPETILNLSRSIHQEYFFGEPHKIIYQTLCDLNEEGSVGELQLTQRLTENGELEEVGGEACIRELHEMAVGPETLDWYVGQVREKYVKRTLRKLGTDMHKAAFGPTKATDLVQSFSYRMDRIQSEAGSRNGAISIRSPGEILAMPRNPKSNFLGDHLLGVARSLVIAGIGGIGKSRLTTQLLAAFILERIWCGISTHHTKGRRWLLLQTQNGQDRLQNDLERLKLYAGAEWELLDKNLKVHTLETDRDLMLHLSDPHNVREIEDLIRSIDPIGVLFDPLSEFGIGDLNKDMDMMATCQTIGAVSHAGNPERAIIVATHALTGVVGIKKAFGFEAPGFGRNSKVLQAWARAFINVVPAQEDHEVLILSCGKVNDGRGFAPFAVRLNPETMLYEEEPEFDVEEFREGLDGKKKRSTYEPDIVAEIDWPNQQLGKKELRDVIMENTGCSRPVAYRLIDRAVIGRIISYEKLIKLYAKIKPPPKERDA